MIAMIKKAWKNTTDYAQRATDYAQRNWTKITLGGIFAVSLATFTAVFPPAFLPVFITLATLAAGSAIYFAGKAILSFFKTEAAPAVATTATDAKANIKGSTAQVTNTLNANPAPAATVNAQPAVTATSAASAKPTTSAANEENSEEKDATASRSMSM